MRAVLWGEGLCARKKCSYMVIGVARIPGLLSLGPSLLFRNSVSRKLSCWMFVNQNDEYLEYPNGHNCFGVTKVPCLSIFPLL